MKDWMKLLDTLAGKLTAILAFAAIIIIILAWLGDRIPADFRPLVYVLAIGAMAVFTYQVFVRSRSRPGAENAVPSIVHPPERESTPTSTEKRAITDGDARVQYLNAVIADSRAMRLVGLDPQAADPSRGGLTLESLYVSLNTTTEVDKAREKMVMPRGAPDEATAEDTLNRLRAEGSYPLGALEALSGATKRRMVLLGLPGTGKSTFVRYLALRMAQAEMDRGSNIRDLLPGWEAGAILPLIISLGRLAETLTASQRKGNAQLIEEYIIQTLEADERTAEFAGQILRALEREGGLVLFDGLDEVADLNLRPVVVQAIEDFVGKYGRQRASRFLVTCRTYSYYHDQKWQLTGWPTHELALLDAEKIEYFVNAWHDEHIRIEPARKPDLDRKRTRLLESLQPDDRRRLHEIAPFPIILTMMAVVHTHYGELPDTRAEVYERCVDLLLVRWELERPVSGQSQSTQKRTIIDELGISRVVLDRALWEIAFKAHEGRKEQGNARGPALVTEELLTGVLQTHFQDLDKVKIFLDYCQSSNGLLMLQGSIVPAGAPAGSAPTRVYAFPHLTFEEYLAARYLIRPNFGKTTSALVQSSDRWREVVMLLGEYLCFAQGDEERMETLLKALTPVPLPADREHPAWRGIWYAGDLLLLYRRAFPSESSASDMAIRSGLIALVNRGALSHLERASAADTADELGYVPPDLHAFVSIPGKGGTEEAFAISRHPITNAQYERFLNSDFGNREYWQDFPKFDESSRPMSGTWGSEPWEWLQRELREADNGDILYPRYWREPRFGIARRNAPVVGISWYEASAYCQWLKQHWPELEEARNPFEPREVRLPTDHEWALAAGGEKPENRYPWDRKGVISNPDEILQRANTGESGINRTTPVWMYPLGESTKGVMDMSGNVWEWQANFRDNDHNVLSLRGGSWINGVVIARVSSRYDFLPLFRFDRLGFRVVCLPSE